MCVLFMYVNVVGEGVGSMCNGNGSAHKSSPLVCDVGVGGGDGGVGAAH